MYAQGGMGQAVIAADRTIYVGCKPGLCALGPDGALRWSFPVTQVNPPTPTIGADGTIYFVSLDASNTATLHALTPAGKEAWSASMPNLATDLSAYYPLVSEPSIGIDGSIYVGVRDGLHAFAPDGSKKWFYPTPGQPMGTAVGTDGTVFGADNGNEGYYLRAWKPDGTLLWDRFFMANITPPSLGPDGTIYVEYGPLDAISPDNKALWSYGPPNEVFAGMPAIAADGPVRILSSATQQGQVGSLYGMSADGIKQWTAPFPPRYGTLLIDAAGTTVLATNSKINAVAPDGTSQWSIESPLVDYNSFPWTSLGADGTLYISFTGFDPQTGELHPRALVALSP